MKADEIAGQVTNEVTGFYASHSNMPRSGILCFSSRSNNVLKSVEGLTFLDIGIEGVNAFIVSTVIQILVKIELLTHFLLKIVTCMLKCFVQQMSLFDAAYVTIHAAYLT